MDQSKELLPLHHDDREEFQLERIILFTDAVFAIAITLLIIEIKVPEVHGIMTEATAVQGLAHLIPKFIGFIIGFLVIAIYWVAHHRIFRFAHHYNGKLVWLNILFLFSIVLMPFTSAFYTEYTTNINTPFVLYCGSVAMTGMIQCLLQSYLRNPKNGLINPASVGHPDLDLIRPLIAPSAFLIGILLVFIAPWWVSRNVPVLIWPMMMLYNRRYRRLVREYNARQQHSAEVLA